MRAKPFIAFGILFCGLAVCFGAFGAHWLKQKLTISDLEIFEKGVQYQFLHGLALIGIGLMLLHFQHRYIFWAGQFIIAGVIFFSGSLYLLAIHQLLGFENFVWIGPITPLGGMCFIIGWIFFLLGVMKGQRSSS